jgi:hypothetical protein
MLWQLEIGAVRTGRTGQYRVAWRRQQMPLQEAIKFLPEWVAQWAEAVAFEAQSRGQIEKLLYVRLSPYQSP